MKTAKLVIGIVSIVLALVMLFQSCAANVGSVLATAGTDMSGTVGTFAAILLIVAGIIGIAARKSKGGTIAAFIFYVITAICCFAGAAGLYKDLIVWGVVSLVFAVVFIISVFVQHYEPKTK